ncbi:hypothetical protein T11_11258 [Trichinella zimbabwensis]|uniref:Uncharacterized protein n=1 Tax=Trichinella zimbabwensis TaxID=268475 RepID=A0A0V1GU53_9BILA|nr:hypothetical protein T11_11258 [Trichinella zimbabwensis]
MTGLENIFLVFGDLQMLSVRHLSAFSIIPDSAKKSLATLSRILSPAALSASSVMSSANASALIFLPLKSKAGPLSCSRTIISSRNRQNNRGDKGSPCLTPLQIWTVFPFSPLISA